jgi:hypothetical protein
MRQRIISVKKVKAYKKSKAYKSLSDDAKLLYEYALERGRGGESFELDYNDFIIWLTKRNNRPE